MRLFQPDISTVTEMYCTFGTISTFPYMEGGSTATLTVRDAGGRGIYTPLTGEARRNEVTYGRSS